HGHPGRVRDRLPPLRLRRYTVLKNALDQNSKHVVVACGGVVGEDRGPGVGGRIPARREVEAAALAQAGAAAVPRGAAVGPVERHKAAQEREARRALWGGPVVEDAAALAVAAVAANAAGAAGGRVQDDRRVGDGADRPVQIDEAPPWPAPPVPPRRPPLPLSPPAPPVAWLKTNQLSRTSQ